MLIQLQKDHTFSTVKVRKDQILVANPVGKGLAAIRLNGRLFIVVLRECHIISSQNRLEATSPMDSRVAKQELSSFHRCVCLKNCPILD